MQLAGQIALITGGSRGIGRATALAFAREGADIAFCHLDDGAKADATAAEITALGRRALHRSLYAIQPQVCHLQDRFHGWPASPQQGSYSCRKFGIGERLVHTIIGSAVKGKNSVFFPRPTGQYQYWQLRLAGTHNAQHGYAI